MTGPERLILIRHGQSFGNLSEINNPKNNDPILPPESGELTVWQGDDWALTPLGVEQATSTGDFIRSNHLHADGDLIWTSPMTRARQTAEGLALNGLIHIRPNLYERPTTVTYADFQASIKGLSDEDATETVLFETYGGSTEPFQSTIDRIRPDIESVEGIGQQTLIIVSHGYVMSGIRALIEKMNHRDILQIFRQDNATNRRRIKNGDVIVYNHRDKKTGLFLTKQHIGPHDSYVGPVEKLNP